MEVAPLHLFFFFCQCAGTESVMDSVLHQTIISRTVGIRQTLFRKGNYPEMVYRNQVQGMVYSYLFI